MSRKKSCICSFAFALLFLLVSLGCDNTTSKEVSEKNESTRMVAKNGGWQNGTMMQYFHWYISNDGSHWTKVQNEAQTLANMGITALWLPPAYKGEAGKNDVGYGVYDMYDLGEFNQKGTVRTKYGTKKQYLDAITIAQQKGIQIYGDVVFNHRGGADTQEATWVKTDKVAWDNRNWVLQYDRWVKAWCEFNFPVRNNQYSSFKWKWYHFDAVDYDDSTGEKAIFRFKGDGKGWDWEVDTENQNYDYLMYADVDMDHPEVKQEFKDWGEWYVNFTKVDGFRLDAVKHVKFQYLEEWVYHMRAATGKEMYTVAEYWDSDVNVLHNFITKTKGRMSVFDAPLQKNFYEASRASGYYDMSKIMDFTIMKDNPGKAVTLVDNHDTQPLQALERPVDYWFKQLAYAFILLRAEGYPNVFYPDMYGASYSDKGHNIYLAPVAKLDKLITARKLYAYGTQHSYLDHHDVIGWTREGDSSHPKAMAVIMTDGSAGSKWMYTGRSNTRFYDYLGNRADSVWTNSSGWGNFPVNAGSVSVWLQD